jgi:tryptophan-rich sensory protein
VTTIQSTLGLCGWFTITFSAAWLGSRFRPDAWYRNLTKLSCSPPDWVFAPVWLALYVMMAVAVWMVWSRHDLSECGVALGLYLVQLALNAAWPCLFFKKHQIGWALFEIGLL